MQVLGLSLALSLLLYSALQWFDANTYSYGRILVLFQISPLVFLSIADNLYRFWSPRDD